MLHGWMLLERDGELLRVQDESGGSALYLVSIIPKQLGLNRANVTTFVG